MLFIPPYSPQYNPIEEVFSNLKREFRKSLIVERIDIDLAIEYAIKHLKTNSSKILKHYISSRNKCNANC